MTNRVLRPIVAAGIIAASIPLLHQSGARTGMISFVASVDGSDLDGQNYANFDDAILGSGNQTTANGLPVTFDGSGSAGTFVLGTNGDHADPIFSGDNDAFFATAANPTLVGPDTTTYISTGDGSATLTFATGSSSYLGILWGSIDTYNIISFRFLDGTSRRFGGADILANLGMGRVGSAAYVNFSDSAFGSVLLGGPGSG